MSEKNRLVTEAEFLEAVKWAMVEVCLSDDYKKGTFSKDIEDLAFGLPKFKDVERESNGNN